MNTSAALLKATFNGISEIYAEDCIVCPECHSHQNGHIKCGFYYRYWPGTQQLGLNVMAPVRGRLTGVFSLAPLTEAETADFIAHRLQQAKAPPGLFDDDALEMIAAGCHGNRREIMNRATLLLEDAFVHQEKVVTAQTVVNCEYLENPGGNVSASEGTPAPRDTPVR